MKPGGRALTGTRLRVSLQDNLRMVLATFHLAGALLLSPLGCCSFGMFLRRSPFSPPMLLSITLVIGTLLCCAVTPVEAASCGHYVVRARDLVGAFGELPAVAAPAALAHQKPISAPASPCQGARCSGWPDTPASPAPSLRTVRLHEPLLLTLHHLELDLRVCFERFIVGARPTAGHPSRITRPPRIARGLLS